MRLFLFITTFFFAFTVIAVAGSWFSHESHIVALREISDPQCSYCHDEMPGHMAINFDVCVDCHDNTDRIFRRFALARISPEKMSFKSFFHSSHLNFVDEPACESCHADSIGQAPSPLTCKECHESPMVDGVYPASPPSVQDGKQLESWKSFFHNKHVQLTDEGCVDCHGGLEEMPPSSEVCLSCHDAEFVEFAYDEIIKFAESDRSGWFDFYHQGHSDNVSLSCEDCHSSASRQGKVPVAAACSECHSESFSEAAIKSSSSRRGVSTVDGWFGFIHETHMENVDSCADCHVASVVKPPKNICADCHEEGFVASVADPLSERLVSTGHGPAWVKRHGEFATIKGVSCMECHTEETCVSCHTGDKAFEFDDSSLSPHPSSFMLKHPFAAKAKGDTCNACHEESSCNDCHDSFGRTKLKSASHRRSWSSIEAGFTGVAHEKFPSSSCSTCHVRAVLPTDKWHREHAREARKDLRSCQACHPSGGTCLKCHSARDGLGANPHPAGWGDSAPGLKRANPRTCKKCH